MKKIKVVQIGIGHDHGPSTFHTLLLNPDVFEVVALGVPEDEQRFLRKYEKILQGVPVMTPEEALAIDGVEAAVVEAEDCRLTKYAMMAADGLTETLSIKRTASK